MTVRTWFTLSVLAILALGAAFVYRFVLSPLQPPEILVSVDDRRVEGAYAGSCWHQRGGELRCDEVDLTEPSATAVPSSGTLRVVTAFPEQPLEGTITITSDRGPVVMEEDWAREIGYSLDPGTYLMAVEARYPADAVVRYLFRLRVG